MTGVEILAMEEVAVAYGFNGLVYLFVGLFVAACTALIVGIALYDDIGWKSFLCGAIGGIILGSIMGALAAKDTLPTEYETQYKVTISDEVFMNDFLEVYEIIDQEGKIYTVREKNTEGN